MNDLERELSELLHEDARQAPLITRAPTGISKRVRRRQVRTGAVAGLTALALVVASFAGLHSLLNPDHRQPASPSSSLRTSNIHGVGITYPSNWSLLQLSGDVVVTEQGEPIRVRRQSSRDTPFCSSRTSSPAVATSRDRSPEVRSRQTGFCSLSSSSTGLGTRRLHRSFGQTRLGRSSRATRTMCARASRVISSRGAPRDGSMSRSSEATRAHQPSSISKRRSSA